jgi:type I thyroxine 5'-deiodinase
VDDLERMRLKFKDKAVFLAIYIVEAHPVDEWKFDNNVCYLQPKTIEQRLRIANDFVNKFNYKTPLFVDNMNNEADRLFNARPERLAVVENGVLVWRSGPGPHEYDPSKLEAFLDQHM